MMSERSNHNHSDNDASNGMARSTTEAYSNGNGGTDQDASDPDAPTSYFFLSQSAAQQLPLFRYKGEDRSLLYKYVLSPLATFAVNHLTPSWVAPNVITLSGLVFMIIAYLIYYYYNPLFEVHGDDYDSIPRWIFLYNAVAMLIYQTLDNMDGKQARKTNSSSPLGLLFDHGCDAVNSIFGSANWIIAMALDPRRSSTDLFLCCATIVIPYTLFYISTWEEYYTGALILPIMNGPSEGLMGGALLSLTSYFYGPQFWQYRHAWTTPLLKTVFMPVWWFISEKDDSFLRSLLLPSDGLRNADLIVLCSCMGLFQEIVLKVIATVRRYGSHIVWNLLPYVTLLLCFAVTDFNIWLRMPRTSLHLSATLFVEMTTDLMLQHVTNQTFQPFRWILLPLVLLTIIHTVNGIESTSAMLEWTDQYLLIYTTAAFTYVLFKSVVIIHEICHVLDIWCFDIVTPTQKKKKKLTAPRLDNHEPQRQETASSISTNHKKKS